MIRHALALIKPKPRQFRNYAAALATCDGYEVPDLVHTVFLKTQANRELPLSPTKAFSMLAVLVSDRNPLRVVDLGGACGAEYFNARRLLPASRVLRWTVVETPAMVAQGSP